MIDDKALHAAREPHLARKQRAQRMSRMADELRAMAEQLEADADRSLAYLAKYAHELFEVEEPLPTGGQS